MSTSNQPFTFNFYHEVPSKTLMRLIATKGVLATAIDATSLPTYSSGVLEMDDMKCGQVNHAVNFVGYVTDGSPDAPYWIRKI